MTTIAIVGAGPGLGASVARHFSGHGFAVALISRSQEHVDDLAADLTDQGATAQGFAANAREPREISSALEAAAEALGPIEVLQYSPVPQSDFMTPVLDATVEKLRAPVEQSIYGPVAAVQQVLPGMRALGRGTILLVNGGTAVQPRADYAGTSIAFAGESAYGQILHDALAADGIHVAQLIIPGAIEPGDPTNDPATIAETLWNIHRNRGDYRHYTRPVD